MKRLNTGWTIHIFALLHLCTALLCRAAGLSDTILLTLLTITLTVIICMRERFSLEFTAIAIVLVNIVGYFAGVGLAALLNLFLDSSAARAALATFLTTEFIGWSLWLAARSRPASRWRSNEITFGDRQLKAKADDIVDILARCQKENCGQWAASIPEKYLRWITIGKPVWAPQYTIHKTFMGLLDMYELAGNETALEVAVHFGEWFYDWSGQFAREKFQKIVFPF